MEVPAISLVYLPAAIGLGALHALEPGHAKTMTAAYLIGIHGRWTDAVVLGLAAASTHSLVVVAIAVSAVLVGRQAFAGDALWWLQVGSGAIVALLGGWMVRRRLRRTAPAHHHHQPEAAVVESAGNRCEIAIIDTPRGERMRLRWDAPPADAVAVAIARPPGADERLSFAADPADPRCLLSRETPQEPHAFAAVVEAGAVRLPFAMREPAGHDHAHLDDEAHARAHAAQLPAYVGGGARPSCWQVVAFGAAGGLVPCPASISVMLLALSVGSTASGLALVAGFSLGLALALVGVGLVVVTGLSTLGKGGRFAAISRHAPVISAGVVVASGVVAIVAALVGGHHPPVAGG